MQANNKLEIILVKDAPHAALFITLLVEACLNALDIYECGGRK